MEVEILQWFVRPGDRVRQFDKLCEVQSDKVGGWDAERIALRSACSPVLFVIKSIQSTYRLPR